MKNRVTDVIQYLITMLYDDIEIKEYRIIKNDRERNTGTLELTFSDSTKFELELKQTK